VAVLRYLDKVIRTFRPCQILDHWDGIAQRVFGGVFQEVTKSAALEYQCSTAECVRLTQIIGLDGSAAENGTDWFWSWKDLNIGQRKGEG